MRLVISLAVSAMCGLIISGTAAAQDAKAVGEKYALLVGVKQYVPTELRNLQFTEDDVTRLADILQKAGYKKENVMLMTQSSGASNARALPTGANIREELKLILQAKKKEDTVIVALAGHGVQFAQVDDHFFCPMDTKLADKSTLVSLTDFAKALEECGAGTKLLLVDACRDNPQTDTSRSREEVKLESVTRPPKSDPPGGVAVFYSCSAGEKAYEDTDLKHGVFFHFIIEGLKGNAARDGGDVLLADLAAYVPRNVESFTRSKLRQKQIPEVHIKATGSAPLVAWAKNTAPPKTDYGKIDPRFIPDSVGPLDPVQLPGYAAKDHKIQRVIVYRQLTKNKLAERGKNDPQIVAINASGNRVVWYAPQTGLFSMDPDVGKPQLVWQNKPEFGFVTTERLLVSPDGSTIIWQVPNGPIYRINHDGTDLRKLANSGAEYSPLLLRKWGQRVYYSTRAGLFSVDTQGAGDIKTVVSQKTLLDEFDHDLMFGGIFDVSERGSEVVFRQYVPKLKRMQLCAINGDGTNFRILAKTAKEPNWINISPDGQVVYFGYPDEAKTYAVNWLDGSGLREVASMPPIPGFVHLTQMQRLSMDGRWFAYHTASGPTLSRTDGSDRLEFTNIGAIWGHDTSLFLWPGMPSYTKDFRRFTYIMNAAGGSRPKQIVLAEINPAKAEGLPVVSDIEFSRTVSTNPMSPAFTGTLKAKIGKSDEEIERVIFLISPNLQPSADAKAPWPNGADGHGWAVLRGDHFMNDDGKNGDEKADDGVYTATAFGGNPQLAHFTPGRYLLRIVVQLETRAVAIDIDGVEIQTK